MPDSVPAYHNRAMWPFLEGYYAQAAAAVENESALALAVACMVRAALLCGTNKENVLLETGLDEGLLLSSDSQLWSIAGMLGCFTRDCSASVCLRILWNSVLAFQSLLKAFMSCPGWNTAA